MSDVTDGLKQQDETLPEARPAFGGFTEAMMEEFYKDVYIPNSLFHYTSSAGLLGIISGHKLWFADAAFMNDGSESLHGVLVAHNAIDDFMKDKPAAEKLLAEQLKEWISRAMDHFQPVIFCFSARDNLLNQWRDYGKDIVPYCIEFGTRQLFDMQRMNFTFMISKMIYNFDVQKDLMNGLLELIYREASEITTGREIEEEERTALIIAAAKEIVLLISRFKNMAFEAEDEWRGITFRPEIEGKIPRKYRTSALGVIPYYEWYAESEPYTLPIVGITVGPSPYAQVSDLALKQFLNDCGYGEFRTHYSTIPIRRT
jgi:hypothetical protein